MKTLNKEQFETLNAYWQRAIKHYCSGFYRTFNTIEEATEWLKLYVDNPDDKVARLVFAVVGDRAFLGVHHVYTNSGKVSYELFELTDGKKLLTDNYGYKDTNSIRRVF